MPAVFPKKTLERSVEGLSVECQQQAKKMHARPRGIWMPAWFLERTLACNTEVVQDPSTKKMRVLALWERLHVCKVLGYHAGTQNGSRTSAGKRNACTAVYVHMEVRVPA